jgi:hypothetical protein
MFFLATMYLYEYRKEHGIVPDGSATFCNGYCND